MKRRYLRRQKGTKWPVWSGWYGQACIEYLVIFAVLAVVTAIATSAFFSDITSYLESYRNRIVDHIAP